MLFGTWSQAHAYDPSDFLEIRLKVPVSLISAWIDIRRPLIFQLA